MTTATVTAGVPAVNNTLYHRIRFLVGDPAVLVEIPSAEGRPQATLILRDIEMERARRHARADRVACPADYAPAGGLSGDRETATAQAAAEFLRQAGVNEVVADRTLPLIYAHLIQEAGIAVRCDLQRGVAERRAKDEQELAWLAESQAVTEQAMQMACEMIAGATAGANGGLEREGAPLTSERVRQAIDLWLLARGFVNQECIVNGGPTAADCHDRGSGQLQTEQPVIVDIFPRNRETQYWGDCTRTVVHGSVPDEVAHMHQTVVAAKAAGTAAAKAGVTGEAVHRATTAAITAAGYSLGLPAADAPPTTCGMTHGTGHGIGLDCHEPPLLDFGGPALVVGDCVTIEPGLYSRAIGGVRVEDVVTITADGCRNLGSLPEGLQWK